MHTTKKLPRGPSGKWWSSLCYGTDPYNYVGQCARRFGDRFTLPLVTGPVVVTGQPEDAEAIFSAPADTFEIWAKVQIEPVFGASSIFVATGETHRQHRRAVVPALRRTYDIFNAVLQSTANLRAGDVLDVGAWALSLTLRAITGTLLGHEASDAEQALLTRYVEVSGSDGVMGALLWLWLRKRWYGPWSKLLEAQRQLYAWLDRAIQSGIQTAHAPLQKLVSVLEMLSPNAARDDLLTLLIAGYESTAYATAWALDCLHHHPEALSQLRAECACASEQDLDGLPYLNAVCQETLRLHPVIVQVTRTLKKPMTLGNCIVPAGTSVSPAARLLHHNLNIYQSPQIFRPERFLTKRFKACEYIAFGGGINRCPGADFALRTMKQIIWGLLSQRTLETVEPPVEARVRGLIMVPARPIRLRVT